MTLKGFFLTHSNNENGRRDNRNDILGAQKKPNPMAAVRKVKNKIFAHKHPQKAAPCTLGSRDERGLK